VNDNFLNIQPSPLALVQSLRDIGSSIVFLHLRHDDKAGPAGNGGRIWLAAVSGQCAAACPYLV